MSRGNSQVFPALGLLIACLFQFTEVRIGLPVLAFSSPARALYLRRDLNKEQGITYSFASAGRGKNGGQYTVTEGHPRATPKSKLSRPERKALERAKKDGQTNNSNLYSNRRKHKVAENQDRLSALTRTFGENGCNDLQNNCIFTLNENSSADEVMKAIKRAQRLRDARGMRNIELFLLEEADESFAYGHRASLLARLAVAALHISNHDMARKAIDARKKRHRSSMLPMESSAIIRGMLRVHNVTDALQLLDDELSLPPPHGTPLTDPANQDCIKNRALSIASIASHHFFEGELSMALKCCEMLGKLGPIVREAGLTARDLNMPWVRIIQRATQCESGRRDGSVVASFPEVETPCNLVYAVLKAMTTFPSDNNDRTYEALSNALVRRTVFVTGAINIDGCPEPDRGEVVFVGRSNVGKSSLVNMVTNRKSLAYTSKRPGKTQQFNFFAVNDKLGREKEIKYGDMVSGEKDLDSFYIVDVPGFGFAKVPQKQKDDWSRFLAVYVRTRKTLKVVFHLVDARHGAIDEDVQTMKQMSESLPRYVTYVVVLTKADKNVKGPSATNSGRVSKDILDKTRELMKANGVGNAPIILTSAETKLGRDDIWRYMRLAAET